MWSQDKKDNLDSSRAHILGESCAIQEGPVFSSDQGPRLASHCEAQGMEFLWLFVQKLGDIEGQDPHTLLLNS